MLAEQFPFKWQCNFNVIFLMKKIVGRKSSLKQVKIKKAEK